MSVTTDQIIESIIKREGGYVDHPADRGGPTCYGITLNTLAAWLGTATLETLKSLTVEEAAEIYRAMYLRKFQIDLIKPDELCAHVLDCAVLHGPTRAIRWLQAAVGAAQDGIIGAETLHALHIRNPIAVGQLIAKARLRRIGRVVRDDPTQAEFVAGWIDRAIAFMI